MVSIRILAIGATIVGLLLLLIHQNIGFLLIGGASLVVGLSNILLWIRSQNGTKK